MKDTRKKSHKKLIKLERKEKEPIQEKTTRNKNRKSFKGGY